MKEKLLKRFDEIKNSLEKRESAIALFGFGSAGLEMDRMDDYSDLDFFAIVKDGYKKEYLDQLEFLEEIAPVGYKFKNTDDGYKLMYEDGIFCEFAIFEETELKNTEFPEPKVIWSRKNFDFSEYKIIKKSERIININWAIGEAMTNLYVGLCRNKRGEKISASRFIQNYAVDRVMELISLLEEKHNDSEDMFNIERRFEKRYPVNSELLADMVQGYNKNGESAKVILEFLDKNFEINQKMKKEIEKLI